MHGRHSTVSKMLDKMPDCLDIAMVYSTDIDGYFIRNKVKYSYQYENDPLWRKIDYGLRQLKSIDFDAVIMLGSDDYIDESYINYVDNNINNVDFIGFTDMYYSKDDSLYYWEGYNGAREGEPIGAGRVYTKEIIERMNYNLFYGCRRRQGVDGYSWKQLNKIEHTKIVTTLKENNLMCCDIKDEEGLTSLADLKLVTL